MMMRLMKLTFLMSFLQMPILAMPEGSSLDALQKMFPKSRPDGLQVAAKWLEDSYGAATAEDLNGVSNFAVDAMSFASADESLSADAKLVLRRLFLNEPDAKPQVDQMKTEETPLGALQKMFSGSRLDVLQSATKWLEDNFGATTAEDLDGVSELAVNAMSQAAEDKNLSADARQILQLFFEGKGVEKKRRLASSSSSTTMTSTASTSSSPSSSTTTTTTTPTAATTTTTAGLATTTTTGPTTTTTTGPTTTTATTTTTTVAATTTTITATTTTTSTTSASTGRTYNMKVILIVNDTAWVNSPNATHIMTAAIVASNADVTASEQVNIISLAAGRRLRELRRRLAAGKVECVFDVVFPPSYTGPGLTAATIDKLAMKDELQQYSIAVTSVDVVECTCAPASLCGGSTTMRATTTKGSEVTGGAISAQQFATSIAAILVLKMLSGF